MGSLTLRANQHESQIASTSKASNFNFDKALNRPSLMELPYFDGSPKVWPRFKMTFDETTTAGGFSKLENLNRLQKYLKGEALKAVGSLLLDPNNVGAIIDRLESRFGRVETIYAGLLDDILQTKSPRYENPQTIIDFIGVIGNLVTNMQSLKHPEYLNDQRLLRDLTAKLPGNLRGRWLEHLEDQKALASPEDPYTSPTIAEFYDWIKPHENLATVLVSDHVPRRGKTNPVNLHDNRVPTRNCILCKSAHKTKDCFKFQQLDISKRRDLAFKERLCFACCDSTTHVARNCKYSKPCSVNGCGQKHHPLLHINKESRQEIVNCHTRKRKQIYYEIIPVVLKHRGKEIQTFAFLDSGSSATLIQADLMKELGVVGKSSPMTLAWTNGKTIRENLSMEVSFQISGLTGRS